MSAQPPTADSPVAPPSSPPGTMRCPRCSSPVAAEQDWCLECGAPARTRLAATPNWQLPTVAIAAIVLLAGALLAFAFVKLTSDHGPTASQPAPAVATEPAPAAPVPTPTAPAPAVTVPQPSGPSTTAPPTTVPGQRTPAPPATTTKTSPKGAKGGPKAKASSSKTKASTSPK